MNTDDLRSLLSAERAIGRLSEALSQPKNEFMRDSAIQRFELTFEFAWKVMKGFLFLQGLEERSPRAAIRGAFETGMIPEDERWLELMELRNLTSNTYDETVADRIYAELPETLVLFRQLLSRVREEMKIL